MANKKSNGTNARQLDTPALESWLWDAACIIRGGVDAPKFKDYILPLIFIKRLSDVFEDELGRLAEKLGDVNTAMEMVERDHELVRFFIPRQCLWPDIDDGFAIFPDLLVRVQLDLQRLVPKFLAEYPLTASCRRYYQMHAKRTAGNFPKIDQSIIEKTLVSVPPIAEQRAIEGMFRAVDGKLRAEAGRATALAALFQSLLQNLMTGRVRVKDPHDG